MFADSRLSTERSAVLPFQGPMPASLRHRIWLRRLYVGERHHALLLFVGSVLPLFGYTVKDLFPLPETILLLTLAMIAGAAAIFVVRPRSDEYNGKPEVDWAYDEMLRRAETSIDIVAGDISWLDERRDPRNIAQLLAVKKRDGCEIRLVCKPPGTHRGIRRGIASLLTLGADVRVRPHDMGSIDTTGIITDTADEANRKALRVRNFSYQPGELADQDKKFYWAKRDLPARDDDMLILWKELVDSHRVRSAPAVLLAIWPENHIDVIRKALQKVVIYGNEPSFVIEEVEVADLFSWCLIEDKVRLTEPVVAQFEPQGIPYFSCCFCWSNHAASVLVPPIVERHGSKLIIMEGTHRLWHVFKKNSHAKVRVVVVSTEVPPPGDHPRSISDLALHPQRLGSERGKYIVNYRDLYFRRFNPMNGHLKEIGHDYVLSGEALKLIDTVT